jgi:hypothetical protein
VIEPPDAVDLAMAPSDARTRGGDRPAEEGSSLDAPWKQIWFDGPDDAYLVAAAIRRHLDAELVIDVLLVPTSRGPALELPEAAARDPLVVALVRRFGGHVAREVITERGRRNGTPG